jgi:thiol-disulfide isomerase/thioredoxin
MRHARRRFLSLAPLLALAGAGAHARPAGANGASGASAPAVRAAGAGASDPRTPVAWRDVTLLDGSVLPASALHGMPVVVEFWASWCPFCARQNPHLQALWEAQRRNGLRVLTFSIDKSAGAARRYMALHGYTFPAAMDDPRTREWFGARRGLPMLYVVDAHGRVVQEEAGEMFGEDVAALARFAPAKPAS